jgi:hypothetical protein
MSFAARLDVGKRSHVGKPAAPVFALVMILAFATICLLVLRDTYAPGGAMPTEAPSSAPAAAGQAPPDRAEAKQAPPEQTPAAQSAAEGGPSAPAEPNPDPEEPTADRVSASEQKTFRSRKALETVDPRELLRQGAVAAPQLK